VNEIEVVVDIRQSPDSPELIVVKRKLLAEDIHIAGEPIESRLPLEPGRMAGRDTSPPLERGKIKLSRRAEIALDTLPEETRRRVLDAVLSLPAPGPAHWPADRVKPLATNGSPTYLLRVTPELRAFVAPADPDGIELLDIVRKETLEQFREGDQDAGVQG
jgi:hypothetical protein